MHDPGHVHITASGGCLKICFRPGNLGLAFTIGLSCSRILVDSGMTTRRLVSLQLVIWVHIDNNMSHMLATKHARAIGNILDSIHMLIALHCLSAMGISVAYGIQEDSACFTQVTRVTWWQTVAFERTSGQTTAKSCIPTKILSWKITYIFISVWYHHRYAFLKRSMWHSDDGQPFVRMCEVSVK